MARQRGAAKQGAAKARDGADPDRHPRPLLRRAGWASLDGAWDFAADAAGEIQSPDGVAWDATIRVPFAPESPASGVGAEGFLRRVWYRRRFDAPPPPAGGRVLLHFGAVDYHATVWVNGGRAAEHEGGYTPFAADVTDLLTGDGGGGDGGDEVVVRADDDPHDLAKPRGKQDWHERPHSIWYPRTTGIWQTVWLEPVPAVRVASLRWTPDLPRGEVRLDARVDGPEAHRHRLAVTLRHGDRVLCDDVCSVAADGGVRRAFPVAPAGAEDFAHDLLWTPEHPRLIDADLRLLGPDGEDVDAVSSYTALRSAGVDGDRFLLNRRPRTLRLVLAQGYWADGGLTAPDDGALRRDVELIKSLGFDGVRMHQKVESPRFLYWADRLGLLVWGEMPSPYVFTAEAVRRTAAEWAEVVERDAGHPCVVAWVPVNESWGAPDLPTDPAQRSFVRALYELTKALDPTRPVIANDGWEMPAGDVVAVHDYDADPDRLARRYAGAGEELTARLSGERPGHRRLFLDGFDPRGRALMLTEFGGIAYSERGEDWGYSRAATPEEFAERYARLMDAVRSVPAFAGWCYTQFTDTYQEANGLVTMDRTPKADLDVLRRATAGEAGV